MVKGKVKKTAPWLVAIAAIVGPIFGYMEAREARHLVRESAAAVQVEAKETDSEIAASYRTLADSISELQKASGETGVYIENLERRLEFYERVLLELSSRRARGGRGAAFVPPEASPAPKMRVLEKLPDTVQQAQQLNPL